MPSSAIRPAPPLGRPLQAGDLLLVDAAASVQFANGNSLVFRVSRIENRQPYSDWVWLRGYTIDYRGDATEQRDIYVQASGLKILAAPPARARPKQPQRKATPP